MDELFRLISDLPGNAAVALSGGADSMALLSCAVQALGKQRVLAIHVDHGLQAAAADFRKACQEACSLLGVGLSIIEVDAKNTPGESPEAAARDARYLALAQQTLSLGCSRCLLAHHADDQAETLILALSRGLGLCGLSGMGSSFQKHGALFERPFLRVPSEALRQYCQVEGLAWSEDPSNADARFARNLARAKAMPALNTCFPHFTKAAARSMEHCASAARLLDELADQDLEANPGMDLAALRALSLDRQANLLIRWLKSIHGAYPSQAQVDEALSQISASADRSRNIDIKCAHGRLLRVAYALRFVLRQH